MGHLVFYRCYDHELGDVSVGRWREIRKLLPSLVEYLNNAMTLDWEQGTRRNVTLYSDGSVRPPEAADATMPPVAPFILEHIFRDESDGLNEIYVEDADELTRLFAWYDFLSARDGAAALYAPLIQALRSCTCGFEAFSSGRTTKPGPPVA